MNASARERRAAHRAALNMRELLVVVLLLGAVVAAALAPSGPSGDVPDRLTTVRVSSGDTLWEIASRVSHPGLSTAQAVAQIERLNNLDGAPLEPGMSVRVPAPPAFVTAVAMR